MSRSGDTVSGMSHDYTGLRLMQMNVICTYPTNCRRTLAVSVGLTIAEWAKIFEIIRIFDLALNSILMSTFTLSNKHID